MTIHRWARRSTLIAGALAAALAYSAGSAQAEPVVEQTIQPVSEASVPAPPTTGSDKDIGLGVVLGIGLQLGDWHHHHWCDWHHDSGLDVGLGAGIGLDLGGHDR